MLLKEIIPGTFMQFVAKGVTVGEAPDPVNIVGPSFFPAANTGVWQDFGDCPNGILEPRFRDLPPRLKHLAQGGSWEESRRRLIAATVKFNSNDVCEPFLRLWGAVNGPLVDAEAAAPLRNLDPHIEGWLNWMNRGEDGVDVAIIALYGKLRIDTIPTWGDVNPLLPAWQFEVFPTSIASIITNGIAEAA